MIRSVRPTVPLNFSVQLRSMNLLHVVRPQCSNGYRFANSNCSLNIQRWTIKLQCNSNFVVLLYVDSRGPINDLIEAIRARFERIIVTLCKIALFEIEYLHNWFRWFYSQATYQNSRIGRELELGNFLLKSRMAQMARFSRTIGKRKYRLNQNGDESEIMDWISLLTVWS